MDAKEFLKKKGITEKTLEGHFSMKYISELLTEFKSQVDESKVTGIGNSLRELMVDEKTREGAIECITALSIPKYNKDLSVHLKEDKEHDTTILCADANAKIIDALIESGYIQQPLNEKMREAAIESIMWNDAGMSRKQAESIIGNLIEFGYISSSQSE